VVNTILRAVVADFFFNCWYLEIPSICMFVFMFVHVCVLSFRWCCTRFGAYPLYIRIKISVKTTAAQRLMLGLEYLMPDCWIEVNLHQESPATGRMDQHFPWFPWSKGKC
jgi:hypothetical protein